VASFGEPPRKLAKPLCWEVGEPDDWVGGDKMLGRENIMIHDHDACMELLGVTCIMMIAKE